MAAYQPNDPNSIINNQKLRVRTTQSGQPISNTDSFQDEYASQDKMGMSADTRKAAASGMQSGGLSGGLMQAGMASGNPLAIGGSVILSMIESRQKEKAAAEIKRIEDEKQRMASMQAQYNSMAGMSFNV